MYTLKKSLGQHFLKDENLCRRMVGALQEHPFTRLVEVGPGGGALTKYLLELPAIDFKAIEIDREKVAYLLHTYPQLEGKLLEQDILQTAPPFPEPFTIVGNFPYNISTEIVFRIIDWREQVQCCVGMFQKEVAERIAAPHGSKVYGVTSVLTQLYFDVEYLFDVPPEAFNPPPKVMSGVIRMLPKKENMAVASHQKMRNLVKAAFNQRRKMIRNAVKHLFPVAALSNEIFNKRAEQLSVQDFAALTFHMS